ncbi:hypothetical protein Nhal_1162 [Nitrosococcus halophilus Nc 4]|uniref:Uncharacterized protein n=1 Tax=Nitrosococcus halophilus (strain Nc4) TaxID=472759 RepID=D5BZN3_NITHN|nr:hypothetical protein Nhal_1162 [Nitrosococcus halophilus Nc 4]
MGQVTATEGDLMKKLKVIDQRQERSKKRRPWLKWLCNPRSLRLLILFGQMIFSFIKMLIELMQMFRS